MTKQELTSLVGSYKKAGDSIHDAIRESIRGAGGFLSCTNNRGGRKDMEAVVIFDLDGTLLDTLEDLGAAVDEALSRRDLPGHTTDEYRSMVGHGVRNLVRNALPEGMKDDEALVDGCLADFKEHYTAHIDDRTKPYPGMVELLKELNGKGIRLAVASNKFQAGAEKLVAEFFPGIDFAAVLGDRPGQPLKPSPEIVAEVLRRAGCAKEDAVLVGDSPTDMKTAAAGGIRAIAVSWGYRTMSATAGYPLAKTPAELRALLLHEA